EDSQGRTTEMDNEVDRRGGPPELVPLSGKLEKSIENALIRPTAFKPVPPRSSSSSVETHNNLSTILGKRISPIDRLKDLQDPKLETNSGTFSDSGRNSMSSLPTHSTSGSNQMENLSTSINHMPRHGARMNGNSGSSWMCSVTNGGNSWANGFGETNRNSESTNGNTRSIGPKMDFSGNQELLLEHKYTISEQNTCHLFEEKQRYCAEEMQGLKQRCSTKLRQVSCLQYGNRALRAQQLLQLQVIQLQQDKERLQEEVDQAKVEEQQLQLQISQARMEAFGTGQAKSKAQDGTSASKTLNHNGGTADLSALQKEVERLRGELKEEKQKKHKMMNSFQQERQTWNKEKDKVIRYQKQLQYNYLQMYKKNKDLEKILRELTAEMDSRTEMDMDSHSSDLNFEKIVATEI
uniref:Leucine zipper, putative tumor suppressor 1 n=1 Tax=Cyprinus carpio TaxID=7962 RepID=A0A8C1XUX5_CYPCA